MKPTGTEIENRYRAMFEMAPDAIILHQDGKFIDANAPALRLYGAESLDQLLGREVAELVAADDRQAVRDRIQTARKGGKISPRESRILRLDGREVHVEAIATRIDYGGRPAVMAIIRDITERRRTEEEVRRNEARLESLMRISQHSAGTIQELLDFALAEAISLTGSRIGYIYHYDEARKEFTLNTWSRDVMKQCSITEPQTVYQLDKTGIWGEAVRQGRPIIVNDFAAPNPLKKGYPDGHAPLRKFLTIPVITDGRIVGVVGVANKDADYDDSDIRQLTLLMDSAWKITDRKRAEESLRQSEEKYRSLFSHMINGFAYCRMIFDEQGRPEDFVYLDVNASFGKITGLSDVIGKRVTQLIPGIKEQNPGLLETYGRVAMTGNPERFEVNFKPLSLYLAVSVYSPAKGYFAAAFEDISARKQAEEALRDSEEQFHTLAETITNLAWWANADGYITWYNRRWYEYTGTTPQQMEGWGWQSVHDPQALPAVLERWQASIATGEPFDMTFPLRGADGKFRRFLTRIQPVKDSHGRVVRWFGTNTDVEELTRAEEALRESRAKLQAAFASMTEAIFIADADGRLSDFNDEFVRYHRFKDRVECSRTIADCPKYLEVWFPDGKPAPVEEWAMPRALRGETASNVEYRLRRRDTGETWWGSYNFSTIRDQNGRIAGAIVAASEITERKRAEEALRKARDELEQKVVQRTADLAATVDDLQEEVRQRQLAEAELQSANRVMRMINECDEAMVRAPDEQRMAQEVCRVILDVGGYLMAWVGYAQDDPDKSVHPVAFVGPEEGYLRGANITWADTERGRGPTGTAIRTSTVRICNNFLTDPELAPWRDEAVKRGFQSSIALPLAHEGKTFGALTIYASQPGAFGEAQVRILSELAGDLAFRIMALRTKDELRQRTEQLRRLASELTLTEQRERRRLADVLHDHLQQLLVGARYRMGPLHRAASTAARQTAAEVEDLIAQSIEVSRTLTGELSPPILHTGGLVPALEWLAVWMDQKHGLAVKLQADEDAAPQTEDMTVLLFQSVRELLFNAVKHAGVKSAQVSVDRLDDHVRISVCDEGAGFELDRLRAQGGPGGGFGLYGIRERLGLLGGRMEIDSAPGRGSRFTLWAPVRRETIVAPAPSALSTGSGQAATAITKTSHAAGDGVGKIRVLLADDHIVVRQGLSRLLKEQPDIEVVGEASDGREAVELARSLRPDVVMMDINMPKMDGLEATRILRAELPDTRVIGLSMFEEAERAAAMRQAGAAGYLAKSGPSDALVAAIRDAMPKVPKAVTAKSEGRSRKVRRPKGPKVGEDPKC